jgi:tetratricopeptide (TPR) repeat protein
MSSSRSIYVSAVHEEFPETLESLRLALEELGCQMVVLDACPPYWRTLDKRIRDRIPTCEAVLHVSGQRCGRCPDIPTVPKGQTRRSIAQMELEIANEIAATASKLPLGVHAFISGEEHAAPDWLKPEDEAQKQMQAQHRETLQASGKAHAIPQDGEAWKQALSKLLGIASTQADASYQPPPPSLTIRPAKQEQKKESSGMSPLAIGVIVVGALVVGLGLLDMLKSKKPAEASAAAEIITPYDAAQARQVLQGYITLFRDWTRDTENIPVMYLDHWTRLTLPGRVKMPDSQVKSLLEQSITHDIGADFTVEDRLIALLAAGKYQSAIDFAVSNQATLSAEGFEIAGIAAESRFDQTVSTSHEDRAIRFYRSAVEKTDAQKDPVVWGRRQCELASMLYGQGLHAEASTVARTAVTTLEKVADQAPLDLAYARLLYAQDLDNDQGEELGKKAVALFDQDAYKESPMKLRAWSMLAYQSDLTERLELLKKALNESEQKNGPTHPITGYCLARLSDVVIKAASQKDESGEPVKFTPEQLAEAESYLQRALAICETGYGPKHLNTAYGTLMTGLLYMSQNRLSEAEPMLRRAMTTAQEHLGTRHPKLEIFKISLAGSLIMSPGKQDEAEKWIREAVQDMEAFGVATKKQMFTTYTTAAGVYKLKRKYAETARLLEKALTCVPEYDADLRANIAAAIVDAHMQDQRLGEARLAAEKALPLILRSRVHVAAPERALINILRIHAVWKTQLGEPSAELQKRYQAMFKEAGVDDEVFHKAWDRVSR